MRARLIGLLGPLGLAGASVALCVVGASLAFYGPSIQRIGASAESRLAVDYSAERGAPRFARISASIVAAARADEEAFAGPRPDDGEPYVSVVRPAPTTTGGTGNDPGNDDPPTPNPTRTPAPEPPRPTPTPAGEVIIEVPVDDIPVAPTDTPTAEPTEPTETPSPTPSVTRTPTGTATGTPSASATPTASATGVPTSTATQVPTSTVTAEPTKTETPKPTKTPKPKKDPPGQIDLPPLDPLPNPVEIFGNAREVGGHGGALGLLVGDQRRAVRRRWRAVTRAARRSSSSR